jgi:hypothetical protein
MRLIILSKLTGAGPLVSTLVTAADPWGALARMWWSHPSPGIPARVRQALMPGPLHHTLPESAGFGRRPSSWLPEDPNRLSLGRIVEALVESLFSGEGPKQLARRLSCGGLAFLSRDEAAELLSGFLGAFEAVSLHRVALVQAAVQGRWDRWSRIDWFSHSPMIAFSNVFGPRVQIMF